ncbi:hypothetical protein A2130_00030 [Candidatus Woesebacteria bacterium GWC2_33_12]|uniref:site-specific DNA-methyltransferase (adenine-specific) n=1 Tax=Candidatus Woesebacteria bacterium GW2011_GWB1_33_22 TaxID=1618566 RepID=A0A0G0CJY7_9BACT|nr:MAG: N-6 DNA methylase [Candidatus Woesebacteria bacterium GW2011_GWC2_33_12]KKP41414.1 MAG: N-6 DNA methylase [Candidatus Woesebacteria bacterium GW2011_GWA2_33_20]KKP43742.1 MAG: N-6 DNA methylase [Candidatus Woesebacteria bacterium GW2011_GWB1_33_22]KKP45163.1 MAG: N-6 DNA methylase [Microgenomates group bacterium GW2011_GWC1_33_28]KKP49223.1 MAG: N-6 DNA methylase [Candidatus Woesebacteria bacterium GW2011_GWA1_33_33]OGM06588.1 MAG: hypothetical protein A2130_00030 [Candidatus Woesebact
MLNAETKKIINSARDVLVGKIPDPKAQVEQITFAMFYKFMDEKDNEAVALGGKKQFFTGEFENFSWSKLMDARLGGTERMDLYTQALAKMSQNPHIAQLFRDIYKDAFIPFRSPETLSLFLKEIDQLDYTNTESLGDAFEYLLSVMGSQGDAGQFRTPRHIIDFIVNVVDPQKSDSILDPACGTAGFLISSYKHIVKQHDGKDDPENKETPLTPDEKKDLMKNLMGYDISPDMVRLSKVNLYLHGLPNPTIYEYDTLSSEEKWDENFDVILANPPFMSPKGGIKPHKRFSIQANRAEVLFVDYIIEHLKSNGRAGIIVPEGIIFQSSNAYKELRKTLIEDGLYCVVSLPSGVFNPYAGVKTSVLFFDKEISKRSKHILFVKINSDGFDLGAQRRPNINNDIPLAVEAINKYQKHIKNNGKLSIGGWPEEGENIDTYPNLQFVSKKEILENSDHNLSFERYIIEKVRENNKWPQVSLFELADLQNGFAFKSDDYIKHSNTLNFRMSNIKPDASVDVEYHPKYLPDTYYEKYKDFILKDGDVVIAMTDMAGDPKILGVPTIVLTNNKRFLLNQRVGKFKDIDTQRLFIPYLKYILQSQRVRDYYKSLGGGSAQINISKKDILSIKIPLPPIVIQKEVVEEIEYYQKIIDGAKQVADNWKPNLKIDPNWNEIKIGEICKIERGASPRPIDKFMTKDPKGFNWIKIGDTKNSDKYITQTAYKVTIQGAKKSRKVFIGDFILSNSMSFGRPYIMKIEGYIHDGWLRISEDATKVNKDYLYYILGSKVVIDQFERSATGGVVRNLNSELVKNVKIPLPPLEIQKQIVDRIENEKLLVESNKKIIEIFEEKIKNTISNI